MACILKNYLGYMYEDAENFREIRAIETKPEII